MAKRTPYIPPVSPPFDQVRARFLKSIYDDGDGTNCPCCERWMKVHNTWLTGNMVWFLSSMIEQWYANGGHWVHYKKCDFGGRNYAHLKHWELMVMCPKKEPKKNKRGFWKPTQKGIDFVAGRIEVPANVWICKNTVERWGDDLITVRQARKVEYDYDAMMASRFPGGL